MTEDAIGTVDRKSGDLAFTFVGFFNSEQREFSVSPIGYAGIDYDVVSSALNKRSEELGHSLVPVGEIERAIVRGLTKNEIDSVVHEMLSQTNQWLQSTDKSCQTCKDFMGFNIVSIEAFDDWDENNQIILVCGLETLSPTSNGLRSGLGAFMFDASGDYQAHLFKEYNFTNYTTEEFSGDMIDILERLKNKPVE